MDPVGGGAGRGAAGRERTSLPIHWGTFPLLAGTPAQLEAAMRARGLEAEVHHWAPGDTIR